VIDSGKVLLRLLGGQLLNLRQRANVTGWLPSSACGGGTNGIRLNKNAREATPAGKRLLGPSAK
jgi:hypothetical protein